MPQNTGYYIAAYTAAAAIYLVYALSLGVRMRRLRRRLDSVPRAPEAR